MTAETTNQQLRDVYKIYVNDLYGKAWDGNVSAPLLMHVFDDYIDMEKKIMFVGQETNGWGKMTEKSSVETLQNWYKNFDLGKHADYGPGRKPRYITSQFWNFSRSFFHRMNGVDRKKNGFLWTNISKFDCGQTTPSQELQNLNPSGFMLLKEEISICKPDIVIFLTGGKYDERIKSMFQIADDKLLEGVPIWRVTAPNLDLPRLIFKTEHPRTLSQGVAYRGMKMYHTVLDVIADQCNQTENSHLND